MRRLGWPVMAGMLCLALVTTGCSVLPKEEIDDAPVLVEPPPERTVTFEVERGRIAEEIRGLGRVAAVNEAELYFTLAGRIQTIAVKTGDFVRKGQVLAKLETGDLEYQLDLAKLDYNANKLRYEQSLRLAEINQTLNDPNLKNLELNMEKDRVRVEYLQGRLDASTIRAPFDGRVESVRSTEGQLIKEYDTLFRLADPSELQVQIEISNQSLLSRVVPGQKVRVQVRRGQWVEGQVFQVPSITDTLAPGVPDRRVRVKLNDTGIRLNFDDLVESVIIVREKEDALIVPNAAIREFFGRAFVRVLEGSARREVDVELGIRGQTHTEILSGLTEGQVVIGK